MKLYGNAFYLLPLAAVVMDAALFDNVGKVMCSQNCKLSFDYFSSKPIGAVQLVMAIL